MTDVFFRLNIWRLRRYSQFFIFKKSKDYAGIQSQKYNTHSNMNITKQDKGYSS